MRLHNMLMIFNNGGVFDLSTNNIVRVKVYVPTPDNAHVNNQGNCH